MIIRNSVRVKNVFRVNFARTLLYSYPPKVLEHAMKTKKVVYTLNGIEIPLEIRAELSNIQQRN